MRLTLLKAKEALKNKAPADKLEWRINRMHERVLLHGKFVGSMVKLDMNAFYGQLTPPRWIRTIEGVRVNGHNRQLANRWCEWVSGRCSLDGFSLRLVRDLGDKHPTITDLPAGGSLRAAVASGTDIIRVYGRDSNGMPLDIPISANQTLPNPFATISRVHKEQTALPITLNHIATDLTLTTLAPLEPSEEETCYHRYSIDDKLTAAITPVTAICKLRHIEFTSEQDELLITNISALELIMDALQFEGENDHTTADKYMLKGIDLLNKDLSDSNSDNDIPTIIFKHVGGAPRFYHGY